MHCKVPSVPCPQTKAACPAGASTQRICTPCCAAVCDAICVVLCKGVWGQAACIIEPKQRTQHIICDQKRTPSSELYFGTCTAQVSCRASELGSDRCL